MRMLSHFRSLVRPLKRYTQTGVYFRKMLILTLLIACLPVFIIGIGVYTFGVSKFEDTINQNHQDQISRLIANIDDHFNHIELIATHWANNSLFGNKIRDIATTYDPFYIRDIYNALFVMKDTDSLVDDVILYLREADTVITETSGFIPLNPALSMEYKELFAKPELIYWAENVQHVRGKMGERQLALIHKLPFGSTEPAGCLIVLLDNTKLTRLLNQMTLDNQGDAFLLNEEGRFMQFSASDRMQEQPLNLSIKEQIWDSTSNSDTYIHHFEGVNYSVSYAKMRRIGAEWTFASAVSTQKLTSSVIAASQAIVAISIASLLAAILFTLITSRFLYRPIQRIVKIFDRQAIQEHGINRYNELEFIDHQWRDLQSESESTKQRLVQHIRSFRESFLLQLAQGHLNALDNADIINRMEQLDWRMQHQQLFVLLIRIVNFANEPGRFRYGDEQLASFSAENVIKELSLQQFEQAETINFQDLSIGLMVSGTKEQPLEMHQKRLHELAESIVGQLNQLLKLNVLIVKCKPLEQWIDLKETFDLGRQAIRYRWINQSNEVLDIEDVMVRLKPDFQYPFAIEKELIQAILDGSQEQAMHQLEQFMGALQKSGGMEAVLQHSMLLLLGNIQMAMIRSGYNVLSESEPMNVFGRMSQILEPDALVRWLKQYIIQPYVQEVQRYIGSLEVELKALIAGVVGLMQAEYAKDISLELCADRFGITPYALSKAFKQVMGENYIDHLTRIRLEKAKALLTNSDLKINDIAESVGYQGTYFNRIFKRAQGITPSQYRELHMKE